MKILTLTGLSLALSLGGRGDDDAGAARAALRTALAAESGWVRVHAAEALAAGGEPAAARAAFLAELAVHGGVPRDRIGIHRVLARTAPDAATRAAEVAWLAGVLADPAAPDRGHAAETLAKLGPPHAPALVAAARRWLATASEEEAVFVHWLLWQDGDPDSLRFLTVHLGAAAPTVRLRAAYALRLTGTADPAALAALARAADAEPADSPARAVVVGAAFQLRAAPARLPAWRAVLEELVAAGPPGAAYESLQALRSAYGPADLPRLRRLVDEGRGDVRIMAAWAVLDVTGRTAAP
jgi:hypothetical protein